ncbi:hypothetical protein [Plasticicumulans acidivorans]
MNQSKHCQVEPRSEFMIKDAMQGALDNFARAAVARAVELARLY